MANVSAADNQAALNVTADYTADFLGLGGVAVSDYTQDERIAYLKMFAQMILQQPDAYSDVSISVAKQILGQNQQGMSLDDFINAGPDGSASIAKVFIDSIWDTGLGMGQAAASVGNGVVKLVNNAGATLGNASAAVAKAAETAAAGWVIPLAVFSIIAILAINSAKEVRRAVSF